MSSARTFWMLPLLGLLFSGCVDEKKILGLMEQCPKAGDRLGRPYSVARTWKAGSPGVGDPPLPGCTHKARLKGPELTAELWFNDKDSDACALLYTPTGAKRDLGGGQVQEVLTVTDLRTCAEELR